MVVLVSLIVLLSLSLLLGLLMAVFAVVFEVKEDPMVLLVTEALPGYNCGKCGEPDCRLFAEAVVERKANPALCTPGGKDTAERVQKILREKKLPA